MPRISNTITEATRQRYSRLPWGYKNKVVESLLVILLDAYAKHGELLLGAVLSGQIRLELDLPLDEKLRAQNLSAEKEKSDG